MKRVSIQYVQLILYIISSNMRATEVCMHVFYQSEKLRSPSLSKELCILSVIEILYLWKALPNCSTTKLQTMTQGTLLKMFYWSSNVGTNFWIFCCCACLKCVFLVLVLQGIDDASCAGLKNLLLGAINKCLHNTKDAIQVFSCSVNSECYCEAFKLYTHSITK